MAKSTEDLTQEKSGSLEKEASGSYRAEDQEAWGQLRPERLTRSRRGEDRIPVSMRRSK